MSIQKSQAVKPPSPVNPQTQRNNIITINPMHQQASSVSAINSTQIELSPSQIQLMQSDAQAINIDYVHTLKQAIQQNTFEIDNDQIADALLDANWTHLIKKGML